jgi:tRNA pseudouridine55 synthase
MAAVHGILLLDKPLGLSSNQALGRAKRLLGADKAGHTGALDPLATGMLPCCFGEATKIAGLLLGARKAYVAEVALGVATETGDREGRVVAAGPLAPLDATRLEQALSCFRGRIRQRPPAYSALKRDGVPLYRLARRGEAVEAPEREVEIHALSVRRPLDPRLAAGWRPGRPAEELVGRPPAECDEAWPTLGLEVTCGSGTYIRSLAADLGAALGCPAHLSALRRPWVEPFEGVPMVGLDALQAACAEGRAASLLRPVAEGISGWRRVDVDAAAEKRLRQGQPVMAGPDVEAGSCRVHGPDGGLLALAEVLPGGSLRTRRVFAPGI